MTHDTFTEKISVWLDNELNPDEVAELQTHLAECSACYQVYQAMQHVDQFLHKASTVMAAPSPGFNTRFEARLAQQNVKHWRMWLGLTILFIGTLAFAAIGAIVGGTVLLGASSNLLNTPTLYYWLGVLGGVVNQIRVSINLGGLFFKVALMTMKEPMFWGYVIISLALTAIWFRVMQLLYRRAPVTAMLFV